MNTKNILQWLLRIVAAVILFQSLYFKFTAHEESVTLFTMLQMEPWGRIGTGVLELVAGVLLLIPAFTAFGALMGIGLMSGAIFLHFTILGINYAGDPLLFIYAVIAWICCIVLLLFNKQKIISLLKKQKSNA